MITKKQLAALAYGRAVRRANIKKRKTTNASYKCKSSKKKTKANFDEIMAEADKVVGDSAPINVDGNMVDINFEDYVPKHKPTLWEKTKKFVVGAATAAALGGLGYYGLKKAGIIDWKPLEKKLEKMGASAKEIVSVKQALVKDTEEERKKKAAEREKINTTGKKKWNNPWYKMEIGFDKFQRAIEPSVNNYLNKYVGYDKAKDAFNDNLKKLDKLVDYYQHHEYDIDFNELNNALTDIKNDILRYDYDDGFVHNGIIESIDNYINNFEKEYNENLQKYNQNRFKMWVHGYLNDLVLRVINKYHFIDQNKTLKT